MSWLSTGLWLLREPLHFWTSENRKIHFPALGFAWRVFAVMTLCSFLINLMIPIGGFIVINMNGEQPEPVLLLLGHCMFCLVFPLIFYVIVALYKVMFWFSGFFFQIDLSYQQIFNILAYALCPLFLFGSILYLKIVGTCWTFVLITIGIKELSESTYRKAAVTLTLPLVLLLLCMYLLLGNQL
jgi:hypothetical protein